MPLLTLSFTKIVMQFFSTLRSLIHTFLISLLSISLLAWQQYIDALKLGDGVNDTPRRKEAKSEVKALIARQLP